MERFGDHANNPPAVTNKSIKMFINSIKYTLIVLTISMFSKSSCYSQNWEYKDSGTSFLLYDLSIPAGQNDVVFAAGSQYTVDSEGIIIKSVDGGESWETILSGTTHGFTKIEFINPMRGFVVGWDNTFMITVDGGDTWQDVDAGTDIFYYSSLNFYNENIGFAGALTNNNTLEAYVTADGGSTWNLTADTSNMAEFAACYADENILFSVGKDQIISKSIDGGENWTIISSGTTTFYNFEVFFKDAFNGIVSSEDGSLMVTHDSGNSWNNFSTGYHNFYGLNYVGDQIFAAGTDQDVFESQDNGVSWQLIHDGENISTFYDIEFFDNNTAALICGSQGRILKVSDIILLGNSDREFKNGINLSYDPEFSELLVKSEINLFSEIQVYGIDGKLVMKHTMEQTNNNKLNVSTLTDGNYIIRIISDNMSESKKFIKY